MSKKILTQPQRNKLLIAHKLKGNSRFVDKIKAILLLDKGWSFAKIAEALFVDERIVRKHKKTYDEGGLDHLLKDNYKESPTKIES